MGTRGGMFADADAPDGQKPGCLPARGSHPGTARVYTPSLQGKCQMRTLPCGHVPPSGVPVAFPLGKKRIPWRSCSSPQASQGPSGSMRAGESGTRSILTTPSSLGRGVLGIPTPSLWLEVKNYASRFLWQLGGKEFSCQCPTHTFDPWSGEDPTCQGATKPSACTTTTGSTPRALAPQEEPHI